jgi:hypothetical protein
VDMQTMLNNMMAAHREKRMARSAQLTLGELTTKLDAIHDKSKPVRFDFGGCVPRDFDSWRGSYAELALEFDTSAPQTIAELLDLCREATASIFTGYKGGDYRMSRQTPVWVANYGRSGVEGYRGNNECPTVAVIDVVEADDGILITTTEQEY